MPAFRLPRPPRQVPVTPVAKLMVDLATSLTSSRFRGHDDELLQARIAVVHTGFPWPEAHVDLLG